MSPINCLKNYTENEANKSPKRLMYRLQVGLA